MFLYIVSLVAIIVAFGIVSRKFRVETEPKGEQGDRITMTTTSTQESPDLPTLVKQNFDYFCVLDVEGTCHESRELEWPHEIIEWPVVLLGWRDSETRDELVVVDEWRSFVKPVYRPQLTQFCTTLTGITQADVENAPTFPSVLKQFNKFLRKHELLDKNNKKIGRWTWCTDGPWDIMDFVTKQCFISAIPHPPYLLGDIIDSRRAVRDFLESTTPRKTHRHLPRATRLKLPMQLQELGLGPFEGRQHSGIDDTRNIARIVAELARRGVPLRTNLVIRPGKRWPWMGRRPGTILKEHLQE